MLEEYRQIKIFSNRMVSEHMKLFRYSELLMAYPKIASLLEVRIRRATLNDYQFPPSLSAYAIVVDISATKEFATTFTSLNFNPIAGNLGLHVDPAAKFFLRYSERLRCVLVENLDYLKHAIGDSGEDPHRVNKIPLSFNEKLYIDAYGYESILFRANEKYCDAYKRYYNEGECKDLPADSVLSAIGLGYLYKLARPKYHDSDVVDNNYMFPKIDNPIISKARVIIPFQTVDQLALSEDTVWISSHAAAPGTRLANETNVPGIPSEFVRDQYGLRIQHYTQIGKRDKLCHDLISQNESLESLAQLIAPVLVDCGLMGASSAVDHLLLMTNNMLEANGALLSQVGESFVRYNVAAEFMVDYAMKCVTLSRQVLSLTTCSLNVLLFLVPLIDSVLCSIDPNHYFNIYTTKNFQEMAEQNLITTANAFGSRNFKLTFSTIQALIPYYDENKNIYKSPVAVTNIWGGVGIKEESFKKIDPIGFKIFIYTEYIKPLRKGGYIETKDPFGIMDLLKKVLFVLTTIFCLIAILIMFLPRNRDWLQQNSFATHPL